MPQPSQTVFGWGTDTVSLGMETNIWNPLVGSVWFDGRVLRGHAGYHELRMVSPILGIQTKVA